MHTIDSVGMREFRANLMRYTRHSEAPFAVTSHGETVGYYIPVKPLPSKQEIAAMQKAAISLNALLVSKGIAEDEVIKEFRNNLHKKT